MFTRTFTFLLIALHAIAVLSLPARVGDIGSITLSTVLTILHHKTPKKPTGTDKPANGGNAVRDFQ